MVKVNSLRPFQRMHNGVLIHLDMDEWPVDVPLPTDATLARTGAGPFRPYWDLVLKPDQTIEALVGWFIFPLSLDAAIAWYQTEMTKCGWIELTEKGYRMPASAALHFEHPAIQVRVVVGLRDWPERRATDAFIRRVVVHPWQEPQTAEEAPVAQKAAVLPPAPDIETTREELNQAKGMLQWLNEQF